MKTAGCLLVAMMASSAGCGSVDNKQPDARLADTSMSVDSLDGPNTVAPGAVSVNSVNTFAAAANTFTKVIFKTENYDDRNEYDPTTGRFTAMHAGDYLVCTSVYIPSTTFELDLFKNSARVRAFAYATGVAEGCQPIQLAAGDYIEVSLFNDSATVTVADSPLGIWLTINEIKMSVNAQVAGSTSVPSATFTKVPHTNELLDTANEFDAPQATFHPSQNGDYQFCSWLAWNSTTYGGEIDLYVDNTREDGVGDSRAACGGCRTLRLTTTNAVDVRMWQGTGGTVNVPEDNSWDWLTISKMPALVSVETIGTLNVPSVTFTKIPYATELFDDDGRFDVGTSTFTAAAAGDYLFCAAGDANPAAADVEFDLFKNGAREGAFVWGRNGITGCRVVRLAAADQIDVRIWHNNAGTVGFGGNGNLWWWFQASKIR